MHLLANINAAVTPKVAAQMTWSRFVNTRGKEGHNIPVDLFNDPLNRSLKNAVAATGANASTSTIVQCGKSLKGILDTVEPFENEHHISKSSIEHSKAHLAKDEKLIIEELTNSKIFEYIPGHFHTSFPKIKPCISMTTNIDKFLIYDMTIFHQ